MSWGNGSNVAATALATCSAAAMATKHHQLKNTCSAADASLQAFCCRQWKPAALAVVTGKAWALQRCNTQEQKLGGGVTVLEVRTPGCSITRCPSARCNRLASLSGQRQRHGHLFGSCCPTRHQRLGSGPRSRALPQPQSRLSPPPQPPVGSLALAGWSLSGQRRWNCLGIATMSGVAGYEALTLILQSANYIS